MSEVYLRNSIQRIDQALLNTALIHTSLSNPHELQLAAVLVSTLIEFLRGMSNEAIYVKWLLSYLKQNDLGLKCRPSTFRTARHWSIVSSR